MIDNVVIVVATTSSGETLQIELLPGGSIAASIARDARRGRIVVSRGAPVRLVSDVLELSRRIADHVASSRAALVDPSSSSILNRSVDELDLSVRAGNCLMTAGIRTIGDLVARTEREIRAIRHSNRKTARDIGEELEKLGLGFAPEPAPGGRAP